MFCCCWCCCCFFCCCRCRNCWRWSDIFNSSFFRLVLSFCSSKEKSQNPTLNTQFFLFLPSSTSLQFGSSSLQRYAKQQRILRNGRFLFVVLFVEHSNPRTEKENIEKNILLLCSNTCKCLQIDLNLKVQSFGKNVPNLYCEPSYFVNDCIVSLFWISRNQHLHNAWDNVKIE